MYYLPGTEGNGVTGTSTTVGGSPSADSNFSGGTDAPTGIDGSTSLETGESTFDIAADQWEDNRTTALDAIRDVVNSEYGLFWIARDGTMTFKNRAWIFKEVTTSSTVTFNGTHTGQNTEMSLSDIANYIVVEYTPRNTLSTGVIAKAVKTIAVPGSTGATRVHRRQGWPAQGVTPQNTEDTIDAGTTIARLPYVEPDTGRFIGAQTRIFPRKTTDYTVNDAEDGSGFDYTTTSPQRITMSLVDLGSAIEITFTNTATGTLYVRDLQIRGTGVVAFDAEQIIRADQTSIDAYAKRAISYKLPLYSDRALAEALAEYLLSRRKDAFTRTRDITLDGVVDIGGTCVFCIEIGDLVTITEPQTQISAQKHMVAGIEYNISDLGQAPATRFFLRRMDDVTYWILGDSTYSLLGETTRLGL
jgi:hypothetical protein